MPSCDRIKENLRFKACLSTHYAYYILNFSVFYLPLFFHAYSLSLSPPFSFSTSLSLSLFRSLSRSSCNVNARDCADIYLCEPGGDHTPHHPHLHPSQELRLVHKHTNIKKITGAYI